MVGHKRERVLGRLFCFVRLGGKEMRRWTAKEEHKHALKFFAIFLSHSLRLRRTMMKKKDRILQQDSLAQHWARDWRALAVTGTPWEREFESTQMSLYTMLLCFEREIFSNTKQTTLTLTRHLGPGALFTRARDV